MNHPHWLTVRHYPNKIRLGNLHDGGYVIGLVEGGYDCYLSCGVSNEESFTRDFLKLYGIPKNHAYAFDGTIAEYPYEYTHEIQYVKKNITAENTEHTTNLSDYLDRYHSIFLKMDIEGGEYPWLLSLSTERLKRCKQIVIELHGVCGNGWNTDYSMKLLCLEKLYRTHRIIHTHANNGGGRLWHFPDVIEVTCIAKEYLKEPLPINTQILPTPGLDYPNDLSRPDYCLQFPPFVFQPNEPRPPTPPPFL
jgi:hypothetical protein